jgi:hypothetical protein
LLVSLRLGATMEEAEFLKDQGLLHFLSSLRISLLSLYSVHRLSTSLSVYQKKYPRLPVGDGTVSEVGWIVQY